MFRMLTYRYLRLRFAVMVLLLALLAGSARAKEPGVEPLKVVNWNVLYGFNHHKSIEAGSAWLRHQAPDVVALQELNGHGEKDLARLARAWGHPHAVTLKEQGFPVGLTSRTPIEVLRREVKGFHHGYLLARTRGIAFAVVHFWPDKDHEAQAVLDQLRAIRGPAILLGDFNTHSPHDADRAGERVTVRTSVVARVEQAGFIDLVRRHDPASYFSCPSPLTIPRWSKDLAELRAKRQRIDFIFASADLARASTFATTMVSPRLDKISDHYPQVATFGIPVALQFGLIADCQYCDQPTRGARQYRDSPEKLRRCVSHLNQLPLDHTLHLGDFIDREFASFDVVEPIFRQLKAPGHHVLGNHDYDVADRHKAEVHRRLGMPARYHAFGARGWRFLILDGNDISFHAHPADSPERAEAEAYYRERKLSAPRWNGAIGPKQLAWLERELEAADRDDIPVILCCHFPVHPPNNHNLWNAKEVLATIDRHDCVRAYLNGHNHAGNYAERKGVHYLTLKGMVDTDETAYATLHVFPDRIEVNGFGRESDRSLILPQTAP